MLARHRLLELTTMKKVGKHCMSRFPPLKLPAVDRLGVIMDAFALAKAGLMNTTLRSIYAKRIKTKIAIQSGQHWPVD